MNPLLNYYFFSIKKSIARRCLVLFKFSSNSTNCIKVSSFPNSGFLRNVTHHRRMFWSLRRLRDNIFLHFCGCFLFWRENTGEEVSLLIAVAQFSRLSLLFTSIIFPIQNWKQVALKKKNKSWSCKNIYEKYHWKTWRDKPSFVLPILKVKRRGRRVMEGCE